METENLIDFLNTDVVPLLKTIKPTKPNENTSKSKELNLYDLIKQLYITKQEINDPVKYYDLFEDIAARIKENGYYINPNEKSIDAKFLENLITQNKKQKELLKPPVKIEPESEPQPITQINYIPDYLDLFNKISFSGYSFGEKEVLLLNNSLRNLSIAQPNGNVTFFGKIYGTIKDYYIAEVTEVDPPENFNYDADMEKRKEDGVNRNVFFVTNNLCEKWIELPDIKPHQIAEARQIRYIFTGDLERKIVSNPPFRGQEKHYLRCQIARIYHGSKLVPNVNHYTVEDPESQFKPLTPAEKQKPFSIEELTSGQSWIHFPPGILKCGRVSHIIEPPENIDPDEYKKKVLLADPFDKRIKPISTDMPIKIGHKIQITPWSIKQTYGELIYTNPYIKLLDETQPDFDPNEQKDNKVNYLTVCVKSLRWPGAVNFYLGKESYFFYFGNGQKFQENEEDTYAFKQFPIIPNEAPERDEQPEPHFPPEAPVEEKKEEEPQEKKEEEKPPEEEENNE